MQASLLRLTDRGKLVSGCTVCSTLCAVQLLPCFFVVVMVTIFDIVMVTNKLMGIPFLIATPPVVDNGDGSSVQTRSWQFMQNGYPESSSRISLQQVISATCT